MSSGRMVVRLWSAVAVMALASVLGHGGTTRATAQAAPPFRVFGLVTIDGAEAPPGTRIEAVVNGASCGSDRLIGSKYVIDVETASTRDWCAMPGSVVSFRIGGVPARESAVYEVGAFLPLNLSRATVPPLDPRIEQPRMEVVGHEKPVRLKVFPEAEKAEVTVVSRYTAGLALAAVYPATPAGTATLYIIVPGNALIVSAQDPKEQCTTVVGYSNMLSCTVVAGSVVTFQGLGS
jgi:hypothetical protein